MNFRDTIGHAIEAASTGAVGTATSIMAYVKQLVTDVRAITAAGPTKTEMDNAHGLLATLAKQNRVLCSMDFWSATLESVTLTDTTPAGTDVALPDVVVDVPAGVTVVRAVAMFKFRMLDNPGAANALQGDQHIGVQKGGSGGYLDAIFLDDNMFGIAEATREGGDVIIGGINVVAKVDGDATYNLQWTASLVDVADLKFCDIQTGIRVFYSL